MVGYAEPVSPCCFPCATPLIPQGQDQSGSIVCKKTRTEYTTSMSLCTARRKSLVLLLLVLILIVGICCLTTYNSSVDMLAPVLVMLFVLLAVWSRPRPTWAECAIPPLGSYLPAAPDRAPPA